MALAPTHVTPAASGNPSLKTTAQKVWSWSSLGRSQINRSGQLALTNCRKLSLKLRARPHTHTRTHAHTHTTTLNKGTVCVCVCVYRLCQCTHTYQVELNAKTNFCRSSNGWIITRTNHRFKFHVTSQQESLPDTGLEKY